jgi:hypothetical protein
VFRRDGGVRKSVDLPEELKRAVVGDLLLEAACGLKLSGRRGKQPFRSSSRMAAECFHPSTPAVLGGVMARGVGGVKSLPVKLTAGCVAYWVRRLLGLPRGSPQGWRGCVG